MNLEEKKTALQKAVIQESLLISRIKELNELQMLLGREMTNDLRSKIEKEMREFQEQRVHVRDAINMLEGEEQLVLRLRYIEGLPWEEVANTLHCCRSKVFVLHTNALKKLVLD